MKTRPTILIVSAVLSGIFVRNVPLPETLWIVVGQGLFPVIFAALVMFLWEPSSLWHRTRLLVAACVLGYIVDLILGAFRWGFGDVVAFRAGLVLLLIRTFIGVSSLAAGYFALRWFRRLKNA
jgi:hypothetical protein